MEKLEPIIRHRFWILFGVVLILAPIGWLSGTKNLANETEAQRKKITDAESGIPPGLGHPNDENWTKPLKVVNQTRAEQYDAQAGRLFAMQKSAMKWPVDVEHVMRLAKFFDEPNVSGSKITVQEANQIRTVYADQYLGYAERVYQLADPVIVSSVMDEETGKPKKVVHGTVEYPYSLFPEAKDAPWKDSSPDFHAMWKAQLDLWLMESLLKTIKRVNDRREAKSIFDSAIKKIVELKLRGGTRSEPKKAAPTQAGTPAKSSGGGGGLGAGNQVGDDEERPDQGRGQQDGSLRVNPTVVLGPEHAEAPANKAGATPGQPPGGQPGGKEKSNNTAAAVSPWVDETPNFKTRGFVLHVVMRRMDIPLLIRELTDAEQTNFPCEILWINSVDLDQDHQGKQFLLDFDRRRARTDGKAGRVAPMPGGRLGAPDVNGADAPRGGDDAYASAMSESELADVVIIGVLTVYMKPEEKKGPAKPQIGKGSPKNQKPQTPGNVKSGTKQPADNKKKPVSPKGQPMPSPKGKSEPDGKTNAPKVQSKKQSSGQSSLGKPAGR